MLGRTTALPLHDTKHIHPTVSRTARYVIGIDPGVNTGIAVWDRHTQQFTDIRTLGILDAMEVVLKVSRLDGGVCLRVEDPRQISNSRPGSRAMAQGVGSVKRDAKIWEEFVEKHELPCRFIAPSKRTLTKTPQHDFNRWTGWKGRTSNHARDAAMLAWKG